MNRFFLIGLTAATLLLPLSCEQKKEITYSKYTCQDESYSIEIPTNAMQGACIADFMSFEDNSSHLVIRVHSIDESSIAEYICNKDITNNDFKYTLFQSSNTTAYYKITKGNNMWSAYDLYMLKRIADKNYIIQVNSDKVGKSEMVEIIKHMYSTMTQNISGKETVAVRDDTHGPNLEKTYSTRYYTIKYPKGWEAIEHLNEMTDVYIGSTTEDFGFTIVRFETDYSLSDINAEGNKSIKQAGFKVVEDKLITLSGVKCYRAIHEIPFQGQKIKHISYTLKKGNMLYNIKFGSVRTQSQETLAAEIAKSFSFK